MGTFWRGRGGSVKPDVFWAWVILLGVFIVDATVTLLRRLLRGEKVYEAHRSHAYQFASCRFGRHAPVTLAIGAINVLWLLPIALMVGVGWVDGVVGVLVAYMPLVGLAIWFRAGAAGEQVAQRGSKRCRRARKILRDMEDDMPIRTIELLDYLESIGLTDAEFQILHHMPNITIHAHREYCRERNAFRGETNQNVRTRLELVERAFRSAGFTEPARPGVLQALARAAVAEVPLR